MRVLRVIGAFATSVVGEWRAVPRSHFEFAHRNDAVFALVALLGLSVVLLAGRTAIARQSWSNRIVVPAVAGSVSTSFWARMVHLPLLVFLVGVPFIALAVADPYTALVRREASYPGRRICLTIDASSSMNRQFTTGGPGGHLKTEAAFFTTVTAAERFIQMRTRGPYRDLMALVEFGTEAYVITPFTSDYDNILLSLSLIGAPTEFTLFPDQRTLIARAIERSIDLFRAFRFLDASSNVLVIFSDGEDALAESHGRPLSDIMRSALEARIPVYFVRVNYNQKKGDYVPDGLWADAVERTGGKFFAASDERSLLSAIEEIDRVSAGTIAFTAYSTREPRFVVFASIAACCFLVAVAMKLAIPFLQRFP